MTWYKRPCHSSSVSLDIGTTTVGYNNEKNQNCEKFCRIESNGLDMDSYKIIAALLLATLTIGAVSARPGHSGYLGYSSPISYTSYSYPSYDYGHGLYSSYSYPYYSYGHGYGQGLGYGHGGYGLGSFPGNYW